MFGLRKETRKLNSCPKRGPTSASTSRTLLSDSMRTSTTYPEQPSPDLCEAAPTLSDWCLHAWFVHGPTRRGRVGMKLRKHLPDVEAASFWEETKSHHAIIRNLLYARHEAGAEKSYSQRRREMQSQMKFDGMQLLDANGSWKTSRVKESNPAQHLGKLSHLAQDRTWKTERAALSCNPDRPFARQSHPHGRLYLRI